MKVIVVGAGVGGPALANGLRGAGIDVAVYERDQSPLIRRSSAAGATACTSATPPTS
ncbi:hypothetical protein [Nonomuraea sp. PA05]|uniref:hypothetical protein n=1 Tax=Nonomuraea sp. PA05 TaxID=2604466 RepID=UPI0016523703|nr:hypothetical protein [Nonomuraea sp. PA05]